MPTVSPATKPASALTVDRILLAFARSAGLQGFPPDRQWQLLRGAPCTALLADDRLDLFVADVDVAVAIVLCAGAMGLRAARFRGDARGMCRVAVTVGAAREAA